MHQAKRTIRYAWLGRRLALASLGWLIATIAFLTPALVQPAIAGPIDPYVARFLDATNPVELPRDAGTVQTFTGIELTAGKRLFEQNCKNCHVGGATLPNPTVPLSLAALQGATPPRDTIEGLVAFLRSPMTYDGSEEALECRQVSEDWMDSAQAEKLAAFILRSAQKAPGWGTSDF